MEKNNRIGYSRPYSVNLGLAMKLTTILLILSIFTVQANSYSQKTKVTLDLEKVSMQQVFEEIESLTDFKFLYDNKKIDADKLVSVKVDNKPISDVLDILFKDTSVYYLLRNKQIVLKVKNTSIPSKSNEKRKAIKEGKLVQQIISGTITDDKGQPLPGANVVEKGTTNGVTADFDGNFSITLESESPILVISYIGFSTQEITVDGQTILSISLKEDAAGLEEVVLIGYGSVKKTDLTGSVSSVSSETLEKLQLTTIDDALRGNAAGVQVVQTSGAPGAETTIRIRGNNSIQGNNSPLYVVDGLPIQGGLNNLNPNSIESMEVLKDASATAIYGARAANGVVIVTTKQGLKGESAISISLNSGVENVSRRLAVLDGEQYAILANEAATNEGKSPVFDMANLQNANTDWQDLIYSSGFRRDYNLTFSGGNDKSVYSVMGNLLNIKGPIEKTGFQRQSIQLNFTQNIRDWLKMENHYNLSHTKLNNAEGGRPGDIGGNSRNTSISSALAAPPIFAPYDGDGNYSLLNPYPFIEKILHPLALIHERFDVDNSYNIFGTTGLNFSISDDLKLEVKGGINYKDSRIDSYNTSKLDPGSTNSGSIQSHNSFYWLFQSTLSYDKQINDNNRISALIGFTSEEQNDKFLQGSGSDYPNENTTNQSLQSASSPGIPQSSVSQFRLISYLGRINYSLLDKYLFTATGRYDGSSRLGPDNKYGFFPSFAIGWRLSEEDFINNLNLFSTLKLRGSWGITGNTNISPYLSLAGFNVTQSFIDGPSNLAIGYVPSNLANPELKWEETNQYDFGLDFGFLKKRLNFSIDYYLKETQDLLAQVNLPQSSGFRSILSNVGTVENKGIEVLANAIIIDKNDLYFSSSITFSKNQNKVLETSNNDLIFGSSQNVFPPITVSMEGYPISSFWGMVRSDLLTEDGHDQFEDINNDGQITGEDNTIIGNPHPDFIYSLSSNFEFKNITIDFLLEGVQGNDIFNYSKMEINDTFSKGGNMTTDVLDRWSPSNPDRTAQYQRMGASTFPTPTAQFVEDGSYLRLRQLTLGYNLNTSNNFFKYARVYVRAINLFTITDYSGYNAEVNTFGNNGLNFGIDRNSYPEVRTFSLGINLSL